MRQLSTLSFTSPRRGHALAAMLLISVLASCASTGSTDSSGVVQTSAAKVLACKSGDTMVDSSRQCLQDDAACYQISSGKWCTGERGNVCPAGSVEIPSGSACPRGTRCIPFGESLTCGIPYKN